MPKKKLYIETSVWNQLEHTDIAEWRQTSQAFITVLQEGQYDAYISDVVVREIEATRDKSLQKRLVRHINSVNPVILSAKDEIEALTEKYMETVFPTADSLRIINDCSHVAFATVNGIRHIVSFNCKHLVNDRKIDVFNAVNLQNGYDLAVDITMPHRFVDPSGRVDLCIMEKLSKKSGFGAKQSQRR